MPLPSKYPGYSSNKLKILTPTVTGDTAAYATGDNVGGLLTMQDVTLSEAGSGVIRFVQIMSKSLQTATFDVIFFNASPAASTFTNNAAQDIADADLPYVIGVMQCATVVALSGASIHQSGSVNGNGIPFRLASGRVLYAAIVVRGTPTLGSTSDLSISIKILQDAP